MYVPPQCLVKMEMCPCNAAAALAVLVQGGAGKRLPFSTLEEPKRDHQPRYTTVFCLFLLVPASMLVLRSSCMLGKCAWFALASRSSLLQVVWVESPRPPLFLRFSSSFLLPLALINKKKLIGADTQAQGYSKNTKMAVQGPWTTSRSVKKEESASAHSISSACQGGVMGLPSNRGSLICPFELAAR